VPFTGSGVVNEHVVPVMLYSAALAVTVSSVICTGATVAVNVTTLVTGARGEGIVNVKVLTPKTVPRVALVAELKVKVPA